MIVLTYKYGKVKTDPDYVFEEGRFVPRSVGSVYLFKVLWKGGTEIHPNLLASSTLSKILLYSGF